MDQTSHAIRAADLLSKLGTNTSPCLIDVSLAEDVAASPWRLPTAQHIPHRDIQSWSSAHPRDLPIVTICQKGLKLSHGAAALLRSKGFNARALAGGNIAWCDADLPRLALDTAPALNTPWVLPATRDLQACVTAWVIRRWYDMDATLLWVMPEHVLDVATRFNAHALAPAVPLAQSFIQAGLVCPDLVRFLDRRNKVVSSAMALINMLPNLHERDEDLAQAALPFLDAAWLLHCQPDRQENKRWN